MFAAEAYSSDTSGKQHDMLIPESKGVTGNHILA